MDLEVTVDAAGLRDTAILVVEDDQADILLLRRAFRKARIANALIDVGNGQAAIQYLSGDGMYADRVRYPMPFLILLDLRLPKLSGFEVLEWIRDQPELAELIVVVLTASDHVADETKAHELGANSYLIKPGNFDALVELVQGINGRWLMLPHPNQDSESAESPCTE